MDFEENGKKEPTEETRTADNSGEEIEVEVKDSRRESSPEESADISASDEVDEGEAEEQATVSPNEQIRELEDKYLRLAAEFDNFKKRTVKQHFWIAENTRAEILVELLTVQDNFERALAVDDSSSDFAEFRKGTELIFNQIADILSKNGVQPFESIGCKFDPNLHEALLTVETDDADPDTVVQELTKGYKLNDRVLRHAKVAVARESEEPDES
jgi:molecular chaperone GrpE